MYGYDAFSSPNCCNFLPFMSIYENTAWQSLNEVCPRISKGLHYSMIQIASITSIRTMPVLPGPPPRTGNEGQHLTSASRTPETRRGFSCLEGGRRIRPPLQEPPPSFLSSVYVTRGGGRRREVPSQGQVVT